ncbi:hypothetical protein E2562_006679 [Oryza meyeriana var. granulata]|uniref:Uncharacterized protein n=1 Tax=Oryza meyeriana var. granulata TaxID=110450 RepID=A0A6G1EGI1_9ORYZ|nr:hypothetical protein E2562_006679 [Oryza meyeriana var. granulata]
MSKEAAAKRERAMAYALTHQFAINGSVRAILELELTRANLRPRGVRRRGRREEVAGAPPTQMVLQVSL